MIIYLYKKTHNLTGLKYLGKTCKQDPHKYKGSGHGWAEHIKQYGYDVTTEIIKECHSQKELYTWGKYYSNLWNIVEERDEHGNKTWANKIPETGGGALYGDLNPSRRPEVKQKKKEKTLLPGYVHSMERPEVRAKISGDNHQSKKNPGYLKKMSGQNHYTNKPGYISKITGINNPFSKKEVREKKSKTMIEKYGVDNPMKNLEIIQKVSGANHYAKRDGFVSKIKGDNHYSKKPGHISKTKGVKKNITITPANRNYDHTIYVWHNTESNTTENLNRRDMIQKYNLNASGICELISKKISHYKNWIIK